MTAPRHFGGLDSASFPARPLHLAIGIFDGVHLGHRAVIDSAVQSAKRSGGVSAVLTFFPHPSVLFRPSNPTRLISDLTSKVELLGQLGVDAVIVQPFTHEFASIAALDFLPRLKRWLPHLASVYVGENWRFGQGRIGDTRLLISEGRKNGISVFSAPRVNFDGEPVSSTRIRDLIVSGDIASASALLGYLYFSRGRVEAGKQLGRTLGFPTLNLSWSPDLRPRLGVYTVRVIGAKSEDPLPAVANFGLRPTMDTAMEPRLEVHILGACPYDRPDELKVEWLRFLRPELKFEGLPSLRQQIALDVAKARDEFSLP